MTFKWPSVYIHYEKGSVGAKSMTTKQQAGDLESLDVVIDRFVAQYNAQKVEGSAQLDSLLLELRHEDGRLVSLQGEDAPENREDLFLVDLRFPRKSLGQTSKSTSVSKSASSSSSTASSTKSYSASTGEVVKKARQLFTNKSFAQARKICESAIKQGAKDHALSLLLAEILIATEKYDSAVDYAETAIEAMQHQSSKEGSSASMKKAAYVLAKAYFHTGQVNEAWQKLRELSISSSSSSRSAGSEAQNIDLDIIALQAECLFAAGRHSDAANLINGHMGDPGAEEHMSILIAYSSFALQYGKIPEALRALLKAVTLDQKHKKAKKMLCEILAKDDGFAELLNQLPPGEKSAAAYAFLATLAKGHSIISVCIALFTIARQHRPDSTSYALNLIHAIELQSDFDAAIDAAKAFLSQNSILRAGKTGFTCRELLAALDGSAAPRVLDASVVGEAVLWVDDGERGYSSTHSILQTGEGTFLLEPQAAEDAAISTSAEKENLDDNALDLLAIGFTLIKLLYLKGNLSALPALYRVIEPTRHRSKKAIHETSIRNEHAYYQCIAQVLSYRFSCSTATFPNKPTLSELEITAAAPFLSDPRAACGAPLSDPALREASKRPIFAVGDSHCLSSAWSVVNIHGEQRLIVPKLVTGVKHWHLRPDSDFYPKHNFMSVLATIPEKSDVVFIIGEIDCREGILLAVERDMYASVQEGMKSTIAIFSKVVSGLVSTKKLQTWIHPVLPMLKETRPLVLAYNVLYKEAVTKMANPKIAWLDFFEDLLIAGREEQGEQLRPGLVLDGTHISPVYCKLYLEKAMNNTPKM